MSTNVRLSAFAKAVGKCDADSLQVVNLQKTCNEQLDRLNGNFVNNVKTNMMTALRNWAVFENHLQVS